MDMNVTLNDSINSNISGIIPVSSRITWDKVLLGVFLFGNMVVTFVGNVLVLMAVYMEKSLQTAFNFFVVNLAITDVTVAVTAMSFYATGKYRIVSLSLLSYPTFLISFLLQPFLSYFLHGSHLLE